MKDLLFQNMLLVAVFLLLVSTAASIVAAGGHNPENAAQKSDLVIHGNVSSIDYSRDVEGHHPVQINVSEVFKGNTTSRSVTVQVGGTERMSVSTAASFTEEEEVVVMLEQKGRHYYMTAGYATKYEVENGSIQLVAPERRHFTVEEIETIVEDAPASNKTSQEDEAEVEITAGKKEVISRIISFLSNLLF